MRCNLPFVGFGSLRVGLAMLVFALAPCAFAQESKPGTSELEKAAELRTKPVLGTRSELKPVAPLFDPNKELTNPTLSTYRKPSRLKAGVYAPTKKAVRNATADAYVSFGASVDLPPTGVTQPFTPELYLDGAYHHSEADDTEATILGIGVGFRYYLKTEKGFSQNHPHFYVGAGVGGYYIRTQLQGIKADKVTFGGKVTAGLDLRDGWAIEGSYLMPGKFNGTDFAGLTAQLAYRF